jgi:hypothetical protein
MAQTGQVIGAGTTHTQERMPGTYGGQRGTRHFSGEEKMEKTCGERSLLGKVLVEQGAVAQDSGRDW